MDYNCDVCLIQLADKMAALNALTIALEFLDALSGPVPGSGLNSTSDPSSTAGSAVKAGVIRNSPLGSIFMKDLSQGTLRKHTT
jgi:hypothetical protein